MVGDQFLASEVVRFGAYLCLRLEQKDQGRDQRVAVARAPIPNLADRLKLQNEFACAGPPPDQSIAFLRRKNATPRDIPDPGLLHAEWVIHVVAKQADPVMSFCVQARA